ncbi:MAG TPA: hypothetical protein ENG87_05870 [Candidatus Pacearchaeota archaeon]|nr:hypothetical protein [Candidatus Pacearchaeota archaeon]
MAKRKISLKAIQGAIDSPKTPEHLKKGLIKKYGKQLGISLNPVTKYEKKLKRCVKKVSKQKGVKSSYAICKASIKKNPGQYYVVLKGGQIGKKYAPKGLFQGMPIVDTFNTREEATEYAKRMSKRLSPGEKSYYKMRYLIRPVVSKKNPHEHLLKNIVYYISKAIRTPDKWVTIYDNGIDIQAIKYIKSGKWKIAHGTSDTSGKGYIEKEYDTTLSELLKDYRKNPLSPMVENIVGTAVGVMTAGAITEGARLIKRTSKRMSGKKKNPGSFDPAYWYVGIHKGGKLGKPFSSRMVPTRKLFPEYASVYGPYKSRSIVLKFIDNWNKKYDNNPKKYWYIGINQDDTTRIFFAFDIPNKSKYPQFKRIYGPFDTKSNAISYFNEFYKKNSCKTSNPVKIYDDILSIEAVKGNNSLWSNENFRHDFRDEKGKAAVYGLPDGSILIKGKKKLWKNFDYDKEDI